MSSPPYDFEKINEIFNSSPTDDILLSHEECIARSLYCYGMEHACRKEAERSEAYGRSSTYSTTLFYNARDWLKRARHYRKLAEAYEGVEAPISS